MINDLNCITIIGRVTRDVSGNNFRYLTTGTALLNFSIAVNRTGTHFGERNDRVSFFDITVWGKLAEVVSVYISKGKQVAVSGRLEQQRWDQNGKKCSKVVIIADCVQLLGGKEPPSVSTHAGEAYDVGPDGIIF